MNYNFDFKVGFGDTLDRVNLSARYHGTRYWTYPDRPSFWQLQLIELDLFVFSYWLVMRDTIGFHVNYWFEKGLKIHDEITIEIRPIGIFGQIRLEEVVDIVPIENLEEKKIYWIQKWQSYEKWVSDSYKVEPTVDRATKLNDAPVKSEIEKPIFYSVWNDKTKVWESICLKSSRLKKNDLIFHKNQYLWMPPDSSRSFLYLVKVATLEQLEKVKKIYIL